MLKKFRWSIFTSLETEESLFPGLLRTSKPVIRLTSKMLFFREISKICENMKIKILNYQGWYSVPNICY